MSAAGWSVAIPLLGAKDAWITPSVGVAVLALVFTVGSFWWIQARRGRLRCYTSHIYSGSFAPEKLVLVLSLVLHNPAPAPLVVTDMRLRLDRRKGELGKDSTDLPIHLQWIASHSAIYPTSDTRAYAAPFAVDGRKAIERFIEFQLDDPPTLLTDGPYRATVQVIVEPRGWWTRPGWRDLLSYTFNSQFITGGRVALVPRSNDPNLRRKRDLSGR
jgi:hypothetical protein